MEPRVGPRRSTSSGCRRHMRTSRFPSTLLAIGALLLAVEALHTRPPPNGPSQCRSTICLPLRQVWWRGNVPQIRLQLDHAAVRSASKRLRQPSSWFQLVKIRLTTLRSPSASFGWQASSRRQAKGVHRIAQREGGLPQVHTFAHTCQRTRELRFGKPREG